MQATSIEPARFNRYWAALWKYLEPGPAHILMYTAGRFHTVRRLAVAYYGLRNRPKSTARVRAGYQALEAVDVKAAVNQLRREGCSLGLSIRPDVLKEMQSFCAESVCYANGKPNLPFKTANKADAELQYGQTFTTGRYLNCATACPAIDKIINDKYLVDIARGYLGAEPALVGARCWWSYASFSTKQQQAADGQAFHYDLDDYRAICFFFYLSDVDEDCGPHVFVKKSHRKKPLRWLLSPFKSRTDEDIEKTYTREQIVAVTGKAGEGFAEDLFCYHKGTHPRAKDRLLLQVRYRLQAFGGANAHSE